MAVFKQNLGWTTLQDKQLRALESLNKTLEDEFDITKDILDSVEDIPNVIYQASNIIVHGIDAIWNSRELDRVYSNIEDILSDALDDLSEDQEDRHERDRDDQEEFSLGLREMIDEFMSSLSSMLSRQWQQAIQSANTWSDMYNQTIRYIGTDKKDSEQFRRDIVNIVGDLNSDISALGALGEKINPQEAMQQILAISNASNISNIESLKALTTPILLAQQTTNLNLNELAKLGNRMYVQYGFSTNSLESLVDTIRNVSEGQNVSEDQIIQDLDSVLSRASKYFPDAESLEAFSNSLTEGSAFLQANNIQTTGFIEDLKDIFQSNDDPRLRNRLIRKYGSDYDNISSMVMSGQVSKALEAMVLSIGHMNSSTALVARGDVISADDYYDAQSYILSLINGVGTTLDEFVAQTDDSNTARERAEDVYVSVQDQIYNTLQKATSYLATIQETLGVGLDDITLGISVLGNVLPILGATGKTGVLAAGKGLAGLLSSAGPALGIGAALAAVGLVLTNIHDILEVEYGSVGDPYQDALGEEASPYGYGWYETYNPDTESSSWEFRAHETSEEAANYDANAMFEKYLADEYDDLPFLRKVWDSLSTGVLASNGQVTDSVWKDDQRAIYGQIQKILGDPAYSEMYQYYTSQGALRSWDEIQNFANHIDDYQSAFDQDMWYDAESGRWYEVGTNARVSDNKVPQFAKGTNYVMKDQLAYIHRGEAITPAEYNPAANMNELERLRSTHDNTEEFNAMIETLGGILEFMQQWKKDSEKQNSIRRTRELNSQKLSLLKYNTITR